MYYNQIQWKAKMRLWQASEKRKADRPRNLPDPAPDPELRRPDRSQRSRLAGARGGAQARAARERAPGRDGAEIDAGQRYKLIMGRAVAMFAQTNMAGIMANAEHWSDAVIGISSVHVGADTEIWVAGPACAPQLLDEAGQPLASRRRRSPDPHRASAAAQYLVAA